MDYVASQMMYMHMAHALAIIKSRKGVPLEKDWPLAIAALFVADAAIEFQNGISEALAQGDIHAVHAAYEKYMDWYLYSEDREGD